MTLGALLAALLAIADSSVTLRAGEASPRGRITTIDASGITIEDGPAGAARRSLIGWDRVRGVNGERAADAARFMDLAEKLWRARIRLERGDFIAAETAFEEAFAMDPARRGPTGAVVAEGLMRCRLARDARTAAIPAWLAWVSASEDRAVFHGLSGRIITRFGPAPESDASGLAPELPPIFTPGPSIEPLTSGLVSLGGQSGRADRLAAWYLIAARFEAGIPVELPEIPTTDDSLRLVAEIVSARAGDAQHRRAARGALEARLRSRPAAWQEAWILAGIGRSLLREDSADQKLLGVASLLQIPARIPEAPDFVSGIALAESSASLRALGDSAGADRLYRELVARFPNHPALEWLGMRSLPASPPPEARQEAPAP